MIGEEVLSKEQLHKIWITYSGSYGEVRWVLEGAIKRGEVKNYILFALVGCSEWTGALGNTKDEWNRTIREVLESEYPEYLAEYDKLAVLI